MAHPLVAMALTEDIGTGDVTSLFFVPENKQARAFIVLRGEGIVSGTEMAGEVFTAVDPALRVETLISDGSKVAAGALLMRIEGSARSILTAERTALNFLQRLSGIATLTSLYVDQVRQTGARILDTRKTTPGYRLLEKKAVVDGGGTNHRLGLYDRAMVKDNHLVADGDLSLLQTAIYRLHKERPGVQVELEADTLHQVTAFLALDGVDHILLDNMSLDELRSAVAARGERRTPYLEASGNVNLQSAGSIAETGVDFISVGALTHSAPSLDIGLDFVPLGNDA